jgi:hypothetical protein
VLRIFTPDPPRPKTFLDWLKKFRSDKFLAGLGLLTVRREWKLEVL